MPLIEWWWWWWRWLLNRLSSLATLGRVKRDVYWLREWTVCLVERLHTVHWWRAKVISSCLKSEMTRFAQELFTSFDERKTNAIISSVNGVTVDQRRQYGCVSILTKEWRKRIEFPPARWTQCSLQVSLTNACNLPERIMWALEAMNSILIDHRATLNWAVICERRIHHMSHIDMNATSSTIRLKIHPMSCRFCQVYSSFWIIIRHSDQEFHG